MPAGSHRKIWLGLGIAAIMVATAFELRLQGRLWVCACGRVLLWTSQAWGPDTSQHLFDPYSLTHVLHGFILCWLLKLLLPRKSFPVRLWIAIAAESLWEIFENTNTVIARYREATAALGYQGDTVVNSLGDIVACSIGFLLAWRLGFRRSLVVFILMEIVLTIWIRDSLLLEIFMLAHPIKVIKQWQMGN